MLKVKTYIISFIRNEADSLNLFMFIGGIGFLLFGMHIVEDALKRIMSDRIRQKLEKVCKSTIKSTLAASAATALLQSSSGVVAVIISLTESGALEASQTFGLIAGANIGTSSTAWLIAIFGESAIKSELLYPVLLLTGSIIIILMKNDKIITIGEILSGFALIIAGMDNMSSSMLPVIGSDAFTGLTNPLYAFMAGLAVTAVIQSSSASIGLLQIVSLSASLSADTAIPIILGQNIGTCITSLLSSAGACKEAKKTALYHLMFNTGGAVIFGGLFFCIRNIIDLRFAVNPVGIAIIHTVFNIFTAAIFTIIQKKKRLTKSQPQIR